MLPPVAPVVTVLADHGGWVRDFAARVADYKRHRVQVRVMGACGSACTLVTHLDDKHLCVGPDASFSFHQAFEPNPADPSDTTRRTEAGTRYLLQAYPRKLRAWIAEQGGLTANLITLRGAELQALFRPCR